MGLDFVVLMMDVEAWFGVRISDAQAERVRTMGDLFLFLLEHTRGEGPARCPTGQAFYHLRRVLTGELGVDRAQVRPATPLRDLVAAPARSTAWPQLEAALGLPGLPDPDPTPRGPTARGFGITLAAATAGAWLVYLLMVAMPGETMPIAIGLLIWVLVLVLVCELFGIFWLDGRVLRPVPIPTVRDVVMRLVARPSAATEPIAARVWASLVAIVSAHTGIPPHAIQPEYGWDELARRMG
jgi:hypothetical protein